MERKGEDPSHHRRLHALREDQEAEIMQALRQYAARAAQAREELGEDVADPGEAARLVDRIEASLATPAVSWEPPHPEQSVNRPWLRR